MSERGIAMPSVCLTCGYHGTGRNDRAFNSHECSYWRRASVRQKAANIAAHHAEVLRRIESRKTAA